MEIYLIRHTKPQISHSICYGQSDIPLVNDYHADFEHIKNSIPASVAVIYTSPLKRCTQLAQYLSTSNNIIADERLKELNFGDWEMKEWNAIDKDELDYWMSDFVSIACPNGESYKHLFSRATTFFEELKAKEYQAVAVITHGGVIRSLIAYLLEMPLNKSFSIQIDTGKMTKIKINATHTTIEYINK